MTAADIVAAFANGLCPVIPSGIYELPAPIVLGAFQSGTSGPLWDRLCLRGEGRVTLVAPEGQPAVQVYGRNHRVTTVELVGNGAECLKLGNNANDYVGNCFHGDNLILRGGTVGLYNGKFDGSSLRDTIIKECGIGAHVTGNQDATIFDAVTMNDSDIGILVDYGGRAKTSGGVFANNKLCAQVHSSELVMDMPHFEHLRQQNLGVTPEVPQPNGSPFVDLIVNAHLTLRNAFYANQGASIWYSAQGNAGCRIKFEGTVSAPRARANGNCIVTCDDIMRVAVDYNGVATYTARSWPVEFA